MKRLILLFIGVIVMPTMFAQTITDAVRFSENEVNGTARFRAMSGAFGALGGDLSAISINPAGSAVYNRPTVALSISNLDIDNAAEYFGNVNRSSNSEFDLGQVGGVFVFNNTNMDSPWRKFTLGIAYEQTASYDNDFFASGINTRSIDSYFLANAQGLRLDEISVLEGESISDAYSEIGFLFGYPHQQALLGFESFILEPDDINDDANTVYFSNIAPGSFNQEYSYVANGYNGKLTFNAAIQHQDNIFLGLNLNSHFIDYNRFTYLYEGNSNPGSFVTEVGFENILRTTGNGFSFQLGGIAKLSDAVRLGFTYDSPTWYQIEEDTTQYLATVIDDGNGTSTIVLDPRIVNIFPRYDLRTPAKYTGSIALVLSNSGLISFDYSRKDYSNTKLKPESDPAFVVQNNLISNALKAANIYRIGGELRHNQFSFRAGYRLEESPYEDDSFYGDLTGYSLGLGYSFGSAKLDLAYQNSERTVSYQLYDVGLTDAAKVKADNSELTLTLSLSL
ncbi:MAG: transporter [Flavobacteriaceae bacterium]|nr:transporter [Bacteroidia bacterium]MBT8286506.1 transporter [Bacteroidia bacterium]NNF73540.1 transporter [Flavobacteriaceae bacterium]NNK73727.1 transporter [Flavobacteriaceae bacterium]